MVAGMVADIVADMVADILVKIKPGCGYRLSQVVATDVEFPQLCKI